MWTLKIASFTQRKLIRGVFTPLGNRNSLDKFAFNQVATAELTHKNYTRLQCYYRGLPMNHYRFLPRTQTSLFWWKCARKGRREGDNGLRLPSGPFPWFFAVHHQSLVSRSPLPREKRSAWGGGCTDSVPESLSLLISNDNCDPQHIYI